MCRSCATDWTSLLDTSDERCHLTGVRPTLPGFSDLSAETERGKKRGIVRDRRRNLVVLLPFKHCVVVELLNYFKCRGDKPSGWLTTHMASVFINVDWLYYVATLYCWIEHALGILVLANHISFADSQHTASL